jgi:MATE family multidrug resistance protein
MNRPSSLTRFPEGSVRELWTLSLPLMISAFASLFMIFTDRIFLARYSVAALNASVSAGTFAWAILVGFGMVTAMSEVFVAQYNGAKRLEKIGAPVWQMIWFALFSFLVFIPIGIWGTPHFFHGHPHSELEQTYFRWLMFFGPSYALLTAFAGFFIGRGQTAIMIWLAVLANLLNIFLDWILIFGVEGWVPEMGIQGAAIATCAGYFFEAAVLAILFLRKENRTIYGTSSWQFDGSEMLRCIRIGIPQGLFCGLEVMGWTVFFWMMSELSETHITISSICQSFTILLSFFCDGLSRGAASVAGNLMGANKHDLVPRVLRSGGILLLLFSVATSLIFVIDPKDTVQLLFFESAHNATFDPALSSSLQTCMNCVFVYMCFEGFRWVLSGLLAAAGDTLFLLIAGAMSVWVFLLLPIYLIVVRNHLAIEYAWVIAAVYSGLLVIAYWIRFRRGAWRSMELVREKAPEFEGSERVSSTNY